MAVRLPGERPGERRVTVRKSKTFWRSLRQMAAWLAGLGVADAALESTGVCWWPVYHALVQAGIPAPRARPVTQHALVDPGSWATCTIGLPVSRTSRTAPLKSAWASCASLPSLSLFSKASAGPARAAM